MPSSTSSTDSWAPFAASDASSSRPGLTRTARSTRGGNTMSATSAATLRDRTFRWWRDGEPSWAHRTGLHDPTVGSDSARFSTALADLTHRAFPAFDGPNLDTDRGLADTLWIDKMCKRGDEAKTAATVTRMLTDLETKDSSCRSQFNLTFEEFLSNATRTYDDTAPSAKGEMTREQAEAETVRLVGWLSRLRDDDQETDCEESTDSDPDSASDIAASHAEPSRDPTSPKDAYATSLENTETISRSHVPVPEAENSTNAAPTDAPPSSARSEATESRSVVPWALAAGAAVTIAVAAYSRSSTRRD